MPEKEITNFWNQVDLYIAMGIFASVLLAKHLMGTEPLNPKRLTGELILSSIGAAVFHVLGLMKGLSGHEYWLLIFLAALGGVRTIEWILKAAVALKRVSL